MTGVDPDPDGRDRPGAARAGLVSPTDRDRMIVLAEG